MTTRDIVPTILLTAGSLVSLVTTATFLAGASR